MEYYWELMQHDGTRIEIPPSGVEVVKRRMEAGDPIHTRTAVIPVNQIKFFRITDKPFQQERLLEDVARVFRDPQINEDGSISSRWVKKHVTNDRFNRHYSQIPAYRSLGEDNGMVMIAFKLPIHDIDLEHVQYCSDDEVIRLTSK